MTSLKERVKRYHGSENRSLDISQLELEALPILELVSVAAFVQVLSVSRNRLTALHNIASFAQLTALDLSHNQLSSLQDSSLSSLRNLRRLDLSRNALTEFNLIEVTVLSQLEVLVLHHNQLSALPSQEEMGHMRALRSLDVSHNHIAQVTTELETLLRLDDLNLSFNSSDLDVELLGSRARDLYEKVLYYFQYCNLRFNVTIVTI